MSSWRHPLYLGREDKAAYGHLVFFVLYFVIDFVHMLGID